MIKPSFTPLVRSNTIWWNAGGVDLSWRLLSGINLTAENLRAVVTGGIAFATPSTPAALAAPGTVFPLHDRPEARWMDWLPHLQLTNATVATPGNPGAIDLDTLNPAPKP